MHSAHENLLIAVKDPGAMPKGLGPFARVCAGEGARACMERREGVHGEGETLRDMQTREREGERERERIFAGALYLSTPQRDMFCLYCTPCMHKVATKL